MEQNSAMMQEVQPPGESQPNTEGGTALFMDSTISKDDTVGDLSKKRELLSKFSREPEKGVYLLQIEKSFLLMVP